MPIETTNPPYTAIIADDHQIVRQGLRVALETEGLVEPKGISVVAEAENGFEAIAAVKTHKPTILLLDIAMPLAGGAEVVHDIQRWSPDTKIVVLTGINAPGLVSNLLDAGVHGMFFKGSDMQELYTKLPLIIRGTGYIAQVFVDLMESYSNSNTLTEREKQTLNMIIAGKTNKEIANILVISPKTVDKHRTSLMNKLEVHSIAELITYALRNGLIDPEHTS